MSEPMPLDAPDYRAALTEGRLSLIPWSPMLVGRCGSNGLLRGPRGCALADLTIIRNDEHRAQELIVTELAAAPDGHLRAAIVSWAGLLGYGRVWFAAELVTPDSAGAGAIELAGSDCPTCSASWCDDSAEFWLSARHYGVFPLWCRICGHPLPQWTVDAGCCHSDRSTEAVARDAATTTVGEDRIGGGR